MCQILRLQEQLSKSAQLGGEAAGQVAAAQLLAVREQEQRALSAEREQLKEDLMRTHGILGEHQDEAARLRNINQQVCSLECSLAGLLLTYRQMFGCWD